jgi:hypothetical protein
MGVRNNSAVTNPSVSRQHSLPSWNTALAIEAAKTAEMVEKLPAVCWHNVENGGRAALRVMSVTQ